MAEIKTKKTTKSVSAFVAKVRDPEKRKDTKAIVNMMQLITREKPVMWGESIIGFGTYHYKSQRSRQEGDWPLIGLSPRVASLTLYIMPGFKKYAPLLKKLGKHTVSGGSCLYIKRLSDVDQKVLKELIKTSYLDAKKKYKG